jgi:hypothetical protein
VNNQFRGKRAELGVYDDAAGLTQEEKETYHNMLVNRSFDTGINIFDDKFWIRGDDAIEFVVPQKKIDTFAINLEPNKESLQDIINNVIKILEEQKE